MADAPLVRGLPPGPPFRLLQMVRYLRDPYTTLRGYARRYGDLFTVRTARLSVMTGRPELVRQIITAPVDQYGVNLDPGPARVLGMNGTTRLAGRALRRERRLLVPHFQGETLNAMGGVMREAALDAFGGMPQGESFLVREKAVAVALDVILRTVFGADTPESMQAFRSAISAFSEGYGKPSFLLLAAMRFDNDNLPPYRRFGAARRRLEDLLQEAIVRARADGAQGASVLSRIVAARHEDGSPMSDAAIRDNMITTLIAGHETSVVSLSWGLYWLHREPRCLGALLDELAPLGPDADPMAWARLPLLDAVVRESLRLWPVATDINRVLARPMELGGYELPAGTNVAASSAILHYDPDLYPDGDAFRPERFLERRFGPHEFLPFGGGERMCPGSHLSTFEMKVVLATLLTRYRYTLLDRGPLKVKRMGGMMTPSTGVRLRLDGPRR
ncbi:cytochrome P450 [Marinivivus vitaminiproducens]|uniref:cytochrome P450 n=1 Tax=Marinivivus vitaminiproducens TaxID=3035935 RepID=UPI00279F7AA9|nr:cytochrome P450 [Geminicoccaceae bacterium SCSIO 64248]